MRTVWKDVRYGLRLLRKHPAFTAVAVLSLALGIGANATIFTAANAVFFRSLPVAGPERLMSVYGSDENNKAGGMQFMPLSFPNYKDYRERNEVFSGLAAFAFVSVNMSGGGEPTEVDGLMVTGNYFEVLGVKAAYGRVLTSEDDRADGASPVVVLSHGLWRRRFGGDPGVVGQSLTLNNYGFTVAGVAPENFKGTAALGSPDFWVPASMHDQVLTGVARTYFTSRRALLYNAVGRLRDGVSEEQAAAAMKGVAARLAEEYPQDNEKRSAVLVPLTQATINPNQRPAFVMAGILLTCVVLIVLLIACANVANLLLIRATGRRKEMAIRLGMGATPGRLARQLVTEGVTIGLLGGAVGLGLAAWGCMALRGYRPPALPQNALDLSLNWRVIAFTTAVSVLTGVVFGLAPALRSLRLDLVTELKERSLQQASAGRRALSLRNLLVVFQVALSVISLVGAGLFVRSLQNALRIDPGFETEKLLVMTFNVGAQGYDRPRSQDFFRRVQERVQGVPGVQAASLSSKAPLAAGFMRSMFVEGEEAAAGGKGRLVLTNTISTKYFETLGVALLQGRDLNDADTEQSPKVAVINETMARNFWPGQEAVGRRFKFFGDDAFIQVVGVVRDSKYVTVGEAPTACVHLPLRQGTAARVTLHARTAGDPAGVAGAVRREVQALEPTLPVTDVGTISERMSQDLWAPRMGAALLSIFGALALGLAAVGIYGVVAYSVSQRTNEIAIRMALGAQPRSIIALVMMGAVPLVAGGLLLGLPAAYGLARMATSLLFGVGAADSAIYALVPTALVGVALLACLIPARRATRVDPVDALRRE
jgi:predicted permease